MGGVAVVITDQIGVGNLLVGLLVALLALPASYLALRTWKKENEAQADQKEAQAFRRQMTVWLDSTQGKVKEIHHQTTPVNGHTLAETVEQISTKLDEHMSDGHGASASK